MRNIDNGQSGFTLLEAVVALVLVATSGMALFSWINGNLLSLNHVQDNNARAEAINNAVEYMESVNPMSVPTGNVDLGSYQISWHATAVTPVRDGSAYPAGIGLWQFALYNTKVTLSKAGSELWFYFDINLIGYKRVRSFNNE